MYSCEDTLAGGLPHSDIHGSKPARGSPWLFAACHVLHRLLVPRHPPNALIALDINARQITPTGSPPCAGTIHTSEFCVSKISSGFCKAKSRLSFAKQNPSVQTPRI